jgi:hypothetical protein
MDVGILMTHSAKLIDTKYENDFYFSEIILNSILNSKNSWLSN